MKNQWFTFLLGRIIVKAEGKGIERLINRMTRSGIVIWNVRWSKNASVQFYISLTDLHRVRKIARKSDCRFSFIRGEGIPFLWKRTKKNNGFLVGFFLFFLIALFLSNITWGIDVKGADPATEYKIRKELTNLGIEIGKMHFLVDKPDIIQRKLTDSIDNLTWVGVELRGTTYHFQVVQKTEPEQTKLSSPGDLVAAKRAVIADMFVEKGKPVVKVNQYVQKGQILVSGMIGSEDSERIIPAKGVVWGYTWYKSDVELSLDTSLSGFNGREQKKHYLHVGNFHIPIWGFKKNQYKQFEIEENTHDIFLFNRKLPISYTQKIIREKEEILRTFTKKEAIDAAKKLARRDLEVTIPEDAKVDKENILHAEVENGKVKLSINFQVIENIAEEKAIIQGD